MVDMIFKWTNEMIKQGVGEQHIENMKRKELRNTYPYELYYDIDKAVNIPTLIDTEKIIGIDTAWHTNGRTVYNLFFSVTGEILDFAKEPLHYRRIKENLESLISNGISYQYNFYVDKSKESILRDGLPKFRYFKDDDIYFSGATHRTISAMMFNAPQMIGYITIYKKNKNKFANFKVYQQIGAKWSRFIDNELKHLRIVKIQNDKYVLKVKGLPELELMEFNNPVKDPYELDFESIDEIALLKKNIEELIYKFTKVDESYFQKSNKILKLPLVFAVLKRFKCYSVYHLLSNFNYHKSSNIRIDQSADEIVEGITKIICFYIINENRNNK